MVHVAYASGHFSRQSYQLANLVMADEVPTFISGFATHPFGIITVAKTLSTQRTIISSLVNSPIESVVYNYTLLVEATIRDLNPDSFYRN